MGKTYAVRSAVECINQNEGQFCHLVSFEGSHIASKNGGLGESARELENHFDVAASVLRRSDKTEMNVVLVFLDEAEALVSSTILGTQLALILDRVNNDVDWAGIVVVAATNHIDSIPDYLRRPGRFDQEIAIAPPSVEERKEILLSLLHPLQLSNFSKDENDMIWELAELCVGYVPADLNGLLRRAMVLLSSSLATKSEDDRKGESSTLPTLIRFMHLARTDVGASALRDAALKAPPTTKWDEIAGDPGGAKTALRQAIEWPRTHRVKFEALGLLPPRGILLAGPPGCAKTTLARAAAGASGVAFLSLAPADVYASAYVGEAETIVRRAFSLARSAAPCVLFFDEIDAIVGSNNANESFRMGRGNSAEARVLSTFLNEMDGIDVESSSVDGVLVLAATNRLWTIDAALLRPGRFDKVIHVPPPDAAGRRSILELHTRSWPVDGKGIDFDLLASDEWTMNMTGAEIVGACRDAALSALRETISLDGAVDVRVQQRHLEDALAHVRPLLADLNDSGEQTDRERYKNAPVDSSRKG